MGYGIPDKDVKGLAASAHSDRKLPESKFSRTISVPARDLRPDKRILASNSTRSQI